MSTFESLQAQVRTLVPKANVKPKETSWLMKTITFILKPINPHFMEEYITTIGYTSYFPQGMLNDPNRDESCAAVFAHEAVHMHDRMKNPFFPVLYLLPQALVVLALLSLLAIWFSNFWLLALLFVGCLAPIPAYFRMRYELRAYTMSIAYWFWLNGSLDFEDPEHVKQQFVTSNYYYMWPFSNSMDHKISVARATVGNGTVLSDPMFKLVNDWMVKRKAA